MSGLRLILLSIEEGYVTDCKHQPCPDSECVWCDGCKTGKILAAFKAHIEGLRAKEYMGVCTPAIEDFRKALMELLEI